MKSSEPRDKSDICAIVCVRNERRYLDGLIMHLRDQGVDIAFIDNESTDGSREVIDSHLGTNVLSVHNLPYHGAFSLSDQLQAKAEIEQGLTHDWVMHVDADEILHPSTEGLSLTDVARRADNAGFNAINFEEFVFLPPAGQDLAYKNAHLDIKLYYYLAPTFQRLVRLYRRDQGLDNRSAGGHRLKGNPIIYPENQVLRHYIGLDQTHLLEKYIGRVFDDAELKKGWHFNRVNLTDKMLNLERFDPEMFDYLPTAASRSFLRNRPRRRQFWYWGEEDRSYDTLIQAERLQSQKHLVAARKTLASPTRDRLALAQSATKIEELEAKIIAVKQKQKQRKIILRKQIEELRLQHKKTNREIDVLRKSKSWRLTAPLRKLGSALKR